MVHIHPAPSRPARASDKLDDALLRRIVDSFYSRARQDELLGPVFAARVEDWLSHLSRMSDFWSKAVLGTHRYTGQPFQVHRRIEGLERAHFERWLELFGQTVEELCEPPDAVFLLGLARRMGDGMSLGLGLIPREQLSGGLSR